MSLPNTLAKTVALPQGGQVLVRPLNRLQRYEARLKADLYAAEQVLPWTTDHANEPFLKAEFACMSPAEQLSYLLEAYRETLQMEAAEQFSSPMPPLRQTCAQTGSTEAFTKEVKVWKDAQKQLEKTRQEWVAQRVEQERQRLEGLDAEARLAACCVRWRERLYREAFTMRFLLEALAWAVRVTENPQCRYFRDADEVSDLDDATLEVLVKAYIEVDGVRDSEVPTSPPRC